MTRIEVYGIRHHGPGSARSVRHALERFAPQCVLVEGPPDADEAIPFVATEGMTPPVALLVYEADDTKRAVYYPFAVYSPEWQALDWALRNGTVARFADLGIAQGFAWDRARLEDDEEDADEWRPRDPLALLAEAAGYDDAERWWEHMVEERREAHEGGEIFGALLEGMDALRASVGPPKNRRERARERLREASMRAALRNAVKEGFERIAFVCGAWHAPVVRLDCGPDGLQKERVAKKQDDDLLKPLKALVREKKVKVSCTWIPWTYERLTFESGYGAGVESPGWYDHLWHAADEPALRVGERWLVRVARLLRGQMLEASSAQVIDAVRLADALASMRERPLPGLAEMNEAALAVFCLGNPVPFKLVERELVVGDRLGQVPAEVPQVPLQRDLQQAAKSLRLPQSTDSTTKKLDLREEKHREASWLLHRLNLLGIPWGRAEHSEGKGSYKEWWTLKWRPELELQVIEMGRYGNTVIEAANACAVARADGAQDLKSLTRLLQQCFESELPDATAYVVARLQNEAAIATDVGTLMDALPSLAQSLRYGNVRQSDQAMLRHMVDGLLARIRAGLGTACASLDDEAAEGMFKRLVETHRVVLVLHSPEERVSWLETLLHLCAQRGLHGLVAGRAARMLLEAGTLGGEALARRLALALSGDPQEAASWVEGFLRESGLILVHDDRLWGLLDQWLEGLEDDQFVTVLPLLRRTFSTFSAPERRAMGEQARRGAAPASRATDDDLDEQAVGRVLPILARVLGVA